LRALLKCAGRDSWRLSVGSCRRGGDEVELYQSARRGTPILQNAMPSATE